MASTLLAVDDSVTMRKVLEITFGGTDLKVVTANTPDAALQQLKASKPDLVISDITLDGKTGYELCKAIKQQAPGTQVLLLSSKQNPYDAAKGSDAKADDHMDKPFDTQQMIDKVKKMLSSGPSAGATAAPAPAAAAAAPPVVAFNRTVPGAGPAQPSAPQPAAAAAAPAPQQGTQRAKTLVYSPGAGIPPVGVPVAPHAVPKAAPSQPKAEPAAHPAQVPTPASGVPMYSRATTVQSLAAQPPPSAAPAVVASAQVNGQMASKLEGLGLTPAQVDAVMALSREVVERVVWEVVPVLAETLIKEEIARITK